VTTYEEFEAAAVRSPITLVVMTLDFCGRTFGSAPCLATGTPCYNTYITCKYKSAYLRQSKDYEFTGNEQPRLPGARPYLKDLSWRPTEITDNLTVPGRVTLTMLDEPDGDVGIDPYLAQRTTVWQTPYWKKLYARNPNMRTRRIRILDGFEGLAREDFRPRCTVAIDGVKFDQKGGPKIECVDLLKALDDIKVPPQLDLKTSAAAVAGAAQIQIVPHVDTARFTSPGWIRSGDNLISYEAWDVGNNRLTGCLWGIDGTAQTDITENDSVQIAWHRPQENGFDRVKAMLVEDGGYDETAVRVADFDYWRDWPGGEIDLPEVWVTDPVELRTLINELVESLDCKIWVDEDSMITIRRNMPNEPGREYVYLSDAENIVDGSITVDLNEDSRLSEILLCWAPKPLAAIPSNIVITPSDPPSKLQDIDTSAFVRRDLAANPEAAGPNLYNAPSTLVVFCRWLKPGYIQEELLDDFVATYLERRISRARDPQPIVSCDVELKDFSKIRTGNWVKISTGALVNPDGSPWEEVACQIVRYEPKGNKAKLKLQRVDQRRFFMFAADEVMSLYAVLTTQERHAGHAEYGFWADDSAMMPETYDQAYVWY
jgi:hypothetical protein